MNDDLLGSLTARGIHTLHQLLDLPKETLQSVTGNFFASRLSQVLSKLSQMVLFALNTFTHGVLTILYTLQLGSPTISTDPNECATSKEGF